ncbi:MAG: hypothetical protein ACXWNG_02205, partial [Candidatus Limnocylindrales bacterium]
AWLVARIYVRPRGHRVADISARRAIVRYPGPILLVHGDADEVVPFDSLHRLEAAAASRPAAAAGHSRVRLESLAIPGGLHRWLYEDAGYRSTIARFLAAALDGPLAPDQAAAIAGALLVLRPADTDGPFSSLVAGTVTPLPAPGIDA